MMFYMNTHNFELPRTENKKDIAPGLEICPEVLVLTNKIANALREKHVPDKKIIESANKIIGLLHAKDSFEQERAAAFPKSLKRKLIKKYGGCVGCGQIYESTSRHTPAMELHHIIPRSCGGDTAEDNALIVCRDCHVDVHGA